METAALIIGWVCVCIGILGFFIPDLKIDTVKGEKELLEEKRKRTSGIEENLAWARSNMLGRKNTRDDERTR